MISIRGALTSKIDRLDPRYLSLVKASEKLAEKNSELWGASAAVEAGIRLNWIDLPITSRTLLPELDALAARFRSQTKVILCGMGGSSLAPEVIAATYGKELVVLDSTDPNYLRHATSGDLSQTVVVVSSKSGSTLETASQRALFEDLFSKANLSATEHMVIVTDPGSPLDQDARARNFIVVRADPKVGGRFSALSAFGLVPAALIGVDISLLLDSAADALPGMLGEESAAIEMAYLLAYHCGQYCAFSDFESGMPGLSNWIEQLIAESTGKDKVGRLPIVIESNMAQVAGESVRIAFAGFSDLVVDAPLGAQFIFWEWVTALLGFALQIDPFNQPNVTEAKEKTAALLATWGAAIPNFEPDFVDGSVEIFGVKNSLQATLLQVIDSVGSDGYLAIMAYLDRRDDFALGELRRVMASRSGRPVTFGWGPRFLHSTGQFHKGGQQNGTFLQITGECSNDLKIPNREFTFATLIAAQALGDGEALASRGFSVIRLHLRQRSRGIAQILSAAREII